MRPALLRFAVILAILPAAGIAAAEKTARDLLPASTIVYVELPQPGKLLDLALDHPLARQIEALPEYRQALDKPEAKRLLDALRQVEAKLGMDWRQAARSLSSGGLYVGFDLPTQGVVALVQAADESLAQKARDSALELVRGAAAARGKADPVQADEIRGIAVHQVDTLHLAVLGKWLLVTNKRLLAFMVLENYLGSGGESLAGNAHFQSVLANRTGQPAAWVYVDLRVLQQMGALAAAAKKKSDNPVVELLAGGVLGVLPEATYATAALDIDASRVKLTATLPADARSVAKSREFYFARDDRGGAPPLLKPAGTLLSLATYRDFGSLWRHAPDLFDDRINAQMAETESKLTTFFAGRSFRDDILGKLQPQMQVVVARQEFPQAGITPAIKLPAVGMVMRMKDPETTARIFKITFQSAVGFLNVVGAMKKVDPLELNTEKIGDALVVSTQYLPPMQTDSNAAAAIHFNASPTAIFSGDRFILASARPLALELAEQARRDLSAEAGINTQLVVDGKVGQAALADNREPLVAQNMLSKGHDRPAAEKEIERLLALAANVQGSSLRLATEGQQLQLTVEVALAGSR